MCKREVLQELLAYSVEFPKDQNDSDATHRFPFYAANILASGSEDIANALVKGGVIQSKSDESLETADTTTEKRELRIDDLNIDIEGEAAEEEGKQ